MTGKSKRPADGAPIARRAMLGMFAAGAAGLAGAPYLQNGWERFLASSSQADPTGLTGLLPNPGGFRYFSVVTSVPHKDATDYELTIGGLVDRPKTYTLDELRAMPQTRVVADVLCTDGWRVDDTPFSGVNRRRPTGRRARSYPACPPRSPPTPRPRTAHPP
ncbi:molybdopterin-dependent oxidoreductase, partial [Streptomyces sp. NPDC005568]|uniref:molybdopterin-dependent oxidoreductase n=1 Tax=Streptomyces sp. NPDC005568 TaxID=3156887 RepID=UPI0033B599DB